ncbi:hypothetical protein [Desulfurispora thermophila]|uniref:hypothetical protein n=1 Tax=Desulfurispora thermophila TaxID=265470 RepID=UPI0012EA7896|nr:hypothetical protein [Desulfurispora thermophila]
MSTNKQGGSSTAGIPPVEPGEFGRRINTALSRGYSAATPVVETLAKISLGLGGLTALGAWVFGISLLRRVAASLLGVAIGIAMFYGAPYIVAIVKGLSKWIAGN